MVQPLTQSLLAHYTEIAKELETYNLRYAIKDIMDTLTLHRDKPTTDPYVQKLLAEFDAYTVEVYKRQEGKLPAKLPEQYRIFVANKG